MLSVLLLFWLRTEHKRFEQMKKIEFKTTISWCNFNDFIQWFTLRPRENLNLGAINIKNKLLWNNFTISYPSYKHSNYLGLDISAPLFFCFLKYVSFLNTSFWWEEKLFLKKVTSCFFWINLIRKYLSLNMQIFYTTVWNIFSLGENYHQELFFTLIKKKLKT